MAANYGYQRRPAEGRRPASLPAGAVGEHPSSVTRVEIRLLGGFGVSVDGRRVPPQAWQHRRASDLVKLLALAPTHRLHREQVMDALWPDLLPGAGSANVRKAAHYARAALGSKDAVVLRQDHVHLWPDAELGVDAERFETEGHLALRAGDAEACAAVAAGYTGELLPDQRYEEWAGERRRDLGVLYLQLLRRAGLWEQVVAEEPTDEPAHRALIRMYADAGNRSGALEQYHRLRGALAELGLRPTEETQALYREIAHAPPAASPIAYVETDGVNVAYQLVEGGPADLLMIPGWISHLALDWEEPYWVRWCERMTGFARLIRFDKRGTGLSDRPPGVQALEERMEDAHAVLDAVGVERAHVLGWSEGGPLAMLLAATHPERVLSLVLYGTQACFRREADYPWGATDEKRETFSAAVAREWGELAFASHFAPGGDDQFVRRWATYQRAGASPSSAAELNRMNLSIDARSLLPEIQVPTLALSRRGDPIAPSEAGRYIAEHVEDARFVALEGEDHIMWLGDSEALCAEIEGFVLDVEARLETRNVSGTAAS
jgi:DNA-binding SARP family transcriptional activator/pimeloyl-ACP methyl ester carboxylesterase